VRPSELTEMAVSLELRNTGDACAGAEVRVLVEHALSDRPGDWRVSIVGSWQIAWGPEADVWTFDNCGAVADNRPYGDLSGTHRGHIDLFPAVPRTPSNASVFL
jgi:hypothetical protein